ncbi:MAG: glycosyltransferase family 2 protein [Candidatus Omnitrophica bacterium]|nr:glycosyltransferase family 2 protein [Candidatus Omnitrophota bacterium]
MKISILMPVYNERKTILDILDLVKAVNFDKEIILVDDFSTDGTREVLKERFGSGKENIKIYYHEKNKGKGSTIRTALSHASGDYVIVQDADLEYSPHEMEKLAEHAKKTAVTAVYGSRFYNSWKATSFLHYSVNWFLTTMTNVLFGGRLTDMETCYKMVKTDVLKKLNIKADRFELEPEITAKLLKKGHKIDEVPISYRGRGYDEGKKIKWTDGVEALCTLIKYRFVD